jgi:hypothetical protein
VYEDIHTTDDYGEEPVARSGPRKRPNSSPSPTTSTSSSTFRAHPTVMHSEVPQFAGPPNGRGGKSNRGGGGGGRGRHPHSPDTYNTSSSSSTPRTADIIEKRIPIPHAGLIIRYNPFFFRLHCL